MQEYASDTFLHITFPVVSLETLRMQKRIYYFSGTGNSLYVAKRIREQLDDAELIRITSRLVQENMSIKADVLGFVFPVYAWGPPGIVESFFKTMNVKNAVYTFVVAVHGGGPGNALVRTEKLLKSQGVSIDSAFDVKTPSNYVVGADPASKEEARRMFEDIEPRIADMLNSIVEQRKITVTPDNISGRLKTALIHPLFLMGSKKQGKKFYASAQCTGCGICQQVCPVENIILNADKKPEWQNRCELCVGCINLCPKQAIQAGEETVDRRRYQHPDIAVSELMTGQSRPGHTSV
jgi:ferredoxin